MPRMGSAGMTAIVWVAVALGAMTCAGLGWRWLARRGRAPPEAAPESLFASTGVLQARTRRDRSLLSLAQDVAPLGCFTYDFGTEAFCWSAGLARLFGRPAAAFESTLAEFSSRLKPAEHASFEARLQAAVNEGQELITLNGRVLAPEGTPRSLALRMALRYDADGQPLEMQGVAFDITEHLGAHALHQSLSERLKVQAQEARDARSAREALLNQLNHDLRNRLNVISTGVEVLRHQGLSEKMSHAALDVIARQVQQLASLLNDMVTSTSDAHAPPERAEGSVSPPSRAAGRRVLVLEDHPATKQTLCDVLLLEGHAVTSADDGAIGLQMLVNNRPEVAIVEVSLPGLDGFELALRARKAGYGGWLIALSDRALGQDAQRALRCGFDAHVTKPVDPQHLRRVMSPG